jgi:hypothetical protein
MRKLLLTAMALATAVTLSSCALLPFGDIVYDNDGQQADARMQEIADAVNSKDKAALKALFSARTVEQATDLDQGLDYFLSFFPNGGLVWEQDSLGSDAKVDSNGNETELLEAHYKVSAEGNDYWLVFKDFTVNDAIDPDNVGLYGLGVAPWTENPQTGPARPLFVWAGSIDIDGPGENGYPGVFVPE